MYNHISVLIVIGARLLFPPLNREHVLFYQFNLQAKKPFKTADHPNNCIQLKGAGEEGGRKRAIL